MIRAHDNAPSTNDHLYSKLGGLSERNAAKHHPRARSMRLARQSSKDQILTISVGDLAKSLIR